MKNFYDVLIVGCGPAGAQAAKRISEYGYSVGILDYRLNVGDKLCTGIVGSEMLEHYPDVKNFIFTEARNANIYSGNNYLLEIEKDSTQALIIDREKYIKEISLSSEKLGAKVFLERLVSNIQVSSDEVLIEAQFNGNIEKYKSKILILATGYNSKLAKSLGFNLSSHSMFGYQTKIDQLKVDKVNVFTGGTLPKGYFGWVVPTKQNKGLCGILGREKLDDHGLAFLEEVKEKLGFNVVGRTSAWGIPIEPLSVKSKSRVMLIGDVAGQVKPTTGGGIYFAMRSADIAANIARKAIEKNVFSGKLFLEYSKEWDSIFKNELRIGMFARKFYESLDEKDIKEIMSHIKDSNLREEDIKFDWHSEIIFLAFKTKIKSYLKGSLLKTFNNLTFKRG